MRDKRAKFVGMAKSRVNCAIKDIRLIGDLSNRSVYSYGEDDTRKIFDVLQKELDSARSCFVLRSEMREEGFRLE